MSVNHTGSPQDSQTQVISKYTLPNSSHIYVSTLCQVNLQNQSPRKHKTSIHKYQTQIFKEPVPSTLPLPKKHIRLGHAGIINHSVQLIDTRLNNKKSNGQTQYQIKEMLYKCTTTNTRATWQQAAHTTHQLSSPSCPTRAIQKSLTFNEKYLSFLEKSQENVPLADTYDKIDRAWGLGRRKKQDRRQKWGIKWQPWYSRQEGDIRHPSGGKQKYYMLICISVGHVHWLCAITHWNTVN